MALVNEARGIVVDGRYETPIDDKTPPGAAALNGARVEQRRVVERRYSALVNEAAHVEMHLTVAEQRRMVEVGAKEPCFRMWLTEAEKNGPGCKDWTTYPLSDGRWAAWRKNSDLDKLLEQGEMKLWRIICERCIEDDVV